jgi:hypothetical protein
MKSRKHLAALAVAVVVSGGLAAAAAAAGAPSAPRTPTGTATGTTGDVTLSWTAPASPGTSPVTSYGVSVSANGTTWSPVAWTGSTALTTSSAELSALRCTNVGSGSTGKAIASFYYLQQYLREQSRTVVD